MPLRSTSIGLVKYSTLPQVWDLSVGASYTRIANTRSCPSRADSG
ncbi:hypothetical protein FFLO_05297 [Filobasidium floriforme]|uniref:Uncharacterized protein n=1 Tax=Filobasidium floriforme TaxID=5210 RepID=A0A8K0JJB3_9TREE|nr:hypothetical protein FFLO_05297 [Filobasidium floriforme]